MKCISWNVNGIRAVMRNHLIPFLELEKPEILALQETKIADQAVQEELKLPQGFHFYWHGAKKPGYSSVSTWTRTEPKRVIFGLGIEEIDQEGRVLSLDFGDWVHVNAYFPNSQRDHARLGFKLFFCKEIQKFCDSLRAQGKDVVLCGDFNIAHQEIDLANPKQNVSNAGFLPEEREWMGQFLGRGGYLDVFRNFVKESGHYTWWSYRPGVREKNIGWRLDHHCVNKEAIERVKNAYHLPRVLGSDHCPVVLEWKFFP